MKFARKSQEKSLRPSDSSKLAASERLGLTRVTDSVQSSIWQRDGGLVVY